MPASIDQWRGEIGCFINCIALDFFFCSYDARISFKNLLPVLSFFASSTFLHTSLNMFPYMDNFLCKTSSRDVSSCNIIAFYVFVLFYYLLWCSSLIFLSGDIKTNPRSSSSSRQCFSFCHWNLDSIAAHNFAKLSFLTAYNLVHSFVVICLSETYLNPETPPHDTHEQPIF